MRPFRPSMLRLCVLATLASLGLVPAASALTFAPTIQLDVLGGADATGLNSLGTGSTSGGVTTWTLSAPVDVEGVTLLSYSAQLKEDPFVTNDFVVVNTTGATQTFVASVVLPIPAYAYSEVINSSVGVTTTDADTGGPLSFANSGVTPIFQGTVNGTTVLSLDPPGLPLTTADCPVAFPGCTATSSIGTASVALAPGVATSLGITITFTLSPGDSAGITSRFEIVPEPGVAALLGLALLGGIGLTRRPH